MVRRVMRTAPRRCSLDVFLYGVYGELGILWVWRVELWWDDTGPLTTLFFVTSSRKGINCNFCFCQWNASYYFKWTKVTLWTTSLYYVTLSIGDKVRIEKHVQLYPLTILYPLAIRYVLKNMCNFFFLSMECFILLQVDKSNTLDYLPHYTTLLYPLAIRYVLKNMCNFSFCYEKIYCTYAVLLFLAHADHCLHSPPNSSNSSNIPTPNRSPSLMQW